MSTKDKIEKIISTKNPKIKNLLKLREKKHRDSQKRFLVEGAREVAHAINCGYDAIEAYTCPKYLSSEARKILSKMSKSQTLDLKLLECTEDVFHKVAVREKSDGLLAAFRKKDTSLHEFNTILKNKKKSLLVAIEGIEKPGNLGAILRSIDGSGADGIILISKSCDIYSSNVIRSSLGTIFSIPVCNCSLEEFKLFSESNQLKVFGAVLSERSKIYTECSYKDQTLFLLGCEAFGLTDQAKKLCHQFVKIPMLGIADSLNLSVSGAILLYEAVRQRNIGHNKSLK